MLTRPILALAAAALAALAGMIAIVDGDTDIAPFFVALTLAGGIGAWAVREPYDDRRRWVARAIAVAWIVAAGWIGALLIWYQALCACSSPPRPPEATYLGLTATAYHLTGVYGGGALMVVAAFSRALASPPRPRENSPRSP
jgi:hypothetical protein